MNDLLNYILTTEDAFRKNRLPSLYSDFTTQKKTNPDGYAVNVAAWEQALTKAARHGYISSSPGGGGAIAAITKGGHVAKQTKSRSNHLVLRADESLLRDLEIPEWGRPVALRTVFEEAIRKRTMIPVQTYVSDPASLRKSQWNIIDPAVLSPWNVMSWGMKQLRGLVVGSNESAARLQAQDLVLVENLQETASRVVKQAMGHNSSKMDLVYSKEGFMNGFSTILNEDTELSEADFDLLLLYMSRDSGAIAYDGKTIKFRPSNDTPAVITQQDTSIASIRTLMSTMSQQVQSLERKIAELNTTAKTALHNKNRISALSAVRSKKLAEHNLKQRLDTLTQLEEVYSKIEQAADQIEYVKVMEASTGVLRGLNAQIGDTTKIEDMVDELREEMSKVDEVGSIMSQTGPEIDETELDDELEALEDAEREGKEEQAADKTRQRLSELDNYKQSTKDAACTAATEKQTNAELAESIGRLSRMSVEDNSATQSKAKDPLFAK